MSRSRALASTSVACMQAMYVCMYVCICEYVHPSDEQKGDTHSQGEQKPREQWHGLLLNEVQVSFFTLYTNHKKQLNKQKPCTKV